MNPIVLSPTEVKQHILSSTDRSLEQSPTNCLFLRVSKMIPDESQNFIYKQAAKKVLSLYNKDITKITGKEQKNFLLAAKVANRYIEPNVGISIPTKSLKKLKQFVLVGFLATRNPRPRSI